MTQVLIADPQISICKALKERLEEQGCEVSVALEKSDTMNMVSSQHLDLMLCEKSIFNECYNNQSCKFSPASLPTIILSDEDSVTTVVSVMQCGALGFLTKPIDMNKLNSLMSKITSPQTTPPETIKAKCEPQGATLRTKQVKLVDIIGDSEQMKRVKRLIDKVAPSEARVLILGANGTGKELVAHCLHEKSSRANAPFVEVNCAAIPSDLIESELFGHEKGAFTSAIKQRKGKFEQANGGTLFLDEIGDMSLSAQAKVLRALQERRISRVGGDKDQVVNVRVIAATNKNLREEIERGNFREDLYHRLSVIVINVPSLDEHRDDIPMLVDCFMAQICQEYGLGTKCLGDGVVERLKQMHWGGNIRELRNVIERLIILSDSEITLEDIRLYARA